ncbi:MAG: amidohydrolase family protein [Acidimicrobiia bacterium]
MTTMLTDTGIGYGLFDADEHYYEPEDAVTRHLEREFRHAFQWIDVRGRKTLLINNKLLTLIPNPTYDPVGRPGALIDYFRAQNHDGRSLKEILGDVQPVQPEYQSSAARIAAMDAQGVEFSWLLPSLGLGLEEMLKETPDALYGVFRAYNRWLAEDWGYATERYQTAPLLSLVDPAEAEADLAGLIEAGARLVVLRPAPVSGPGFSRSVADPRHDRVFAMAAEAGVVVSFHAAESGYGKYSAEWGEGATFGGHKSSPFEEILAVHIERPTFDTIAACIAHGLFDRVPGLRVATLELGAGWVPELLRRLRITYGKMPQAFVRDPIDAFHEHVWVTPFYEDNVAELCAAIGTDHVLFGSDWPHPEGVALPAEWVSEVAVLGEADRRKVMRDNLRALAGR